MAHVKRTKAGTTAQRLAWTPAGSGEQFLDTDLLAAGTTNALFAGGATLPAGGLSVMPGAVFSTADKTKLDAITAINGGIIPTAAQLTIVDNALVHADVVDNLTTTTADVPLSANQGKVLNDLVNGLGTQKRYATLALRNAAPAGTFTAGGSPERVFVADAGAGKWASYLVATTTDGSGANTTFDQIMTQDDLAGGLTAAGIKASYEGNADTNAFTDAEKAAIASNTTARHAHTTTPLTVLETIGNPVAGDIGKNLQVTAAGTIGLVAQAAAPVATVFGLAGAVEVTGLTTVTTHDGAADFLVLQTAAGPRKITINDLMNAN